MGRGLSPLQQEILMMAWACKETGNSPWLTRHAVLANIWGWETARKGHTYWFEHWQQFDPSAIGTQAYQSAMASLSRSISRLYQRGLVRGTFGGSDCHIIWLTKQGCIEAERLSVKKHSAAQIVTDSPTP
jgi:hypothetical protein